jgi:hypothetical protein
VPAVNFLDKSFGVGEGVAVSEGGKAIRANHSINFSLSFLLNIGGKRHGEEK